MSLELVEAKSIILRPFASVWAYPVVYGDTVGEPPTSETLWPRVTLRHADGRQSTLSGPANGQCRYEMVGTLWVSVFSPVGDGDHASLLACQEILNAYRSARNQGVSFSRARLNEVGTNGGFEQNNVLVDFVYDQSR